MMTTMTHETEITADPKVPLVRIVREFDAPPRYIHHSNGNEYAFHGCFHEVRPSELIVQTFTYEGMPDGVALEKLVLEDLGNGRTRLIATSLVDSFEARDAFVASGMEEGVLEGYKRLDEVLAG